MNLAVGVHYRTDLAKVISIEFQEWSDALPSKVNEIFIREVDEYVPGKFYKRELPCILEILKLTDMSKIETIIIDGYVVLDDHGKAGLGKYLFDAIDQKIPIIGIAKRSFKDNLINVEKIYRGNSNKPLYVTSVGIDLEDAVSKINDMVGQYRIPDLIRILDRKTKES